MEVRAAVLDRSEDETVTPDQFFALKAQLDRIERYAREIGDMLCTASAGAFGAGGYYLIKYQWHWPDWVATVGGIVLFGLVGASLKKVFDR